MRTAPWIALMLLVAAMTAYGTWRVARLPAPVQPYEMTGSIQELMEQIVEPNADAIFESVAVISTPAGTEDRTPKTDEDWAKVERAALTLAEAANLLRMPGRAVAAHTTATTPTEAVPELTPVEIQQKIDADRAQWMQHTGALIRQAQRAIDYARTKNVAGMFELGGDLDQVCENCHLAYWYPNAPQGPAAP